MPHPMASRRVVYEIGGMRDVRRREIEYRTAGTGALLLRVYDAVSDSPAAHPAVLLVVGYSDIGAMPFFGCSLTDMAMYICWSELLAMSGVTAITYVTGVDPAADTRAALRYIVDHHADIGIDPSRLGLLSFSGNVPTALSLLMPPMPAALRGAGLLWGFTLDADGSNAVASAAAAYHFANPTSGRSIGEIAADVPLFVVRAGRDEFDGLNPALDRFVAGALRRNLPVTVVNHPQGVHAFDLFDDSAMSKRIIRQVLDFFAAVLI